MTTDAPKDPHRKTPLDEEAAVALAQLQTGLKAWRDHSCPQQTFHVNLRWACREVWHRLHDVGRADLAGLINKSWDAIERVLKQIDPKGFRTDPRLLQEPLERLEDFVTLCDESLHEGTPTLPEKPARWTGKPIRYREAAGILLIRSPQDGEVAPDALRKLLERVGEGDDLWELRRGGPARVGPKLREDAVLWVADRWKGAAQLKRRAYEEARATATRQGKQAEAAIDPANTAKHVERMLDRGDMKSLADLAREPN